MDQEKVIQVLNDPLGQDLLDAKNLARLAYMGGEAQVRAFYKQMARIAITPEWARLFDIETRIPDFLNQLARRKSDP